MWCRMYKFVRTLYYYLFSCWNDIIVFIRISTDDDDDGDEWS